MMSTTDEEPFLPFSIGHPLPLMGSNEEVVSGPAPGTTTNEYPSAITNFGLYRYRGIFADSPVHNATKDECITILFWDGPAFQQRLTLAHFPTIICHVYVCMFRYRFFCAILVHFKDIGAKKNLLLTLSWPMPKLCV